MIVGAPVGYPPATDIAAIESMPAAEGLDTEEGRGAPEEEEAEGRGPADGENRKVSWVCGENPDKIVDIYHLLEVEFKKEREF